MSVAEDPDENWMELATIVAVQPAGPEALVGVEGKKNAPGTQAYQSEAIGVVVPVPSLMVSV